MNKLSVKYISEKYGYLQAVPIEFGIKCTASSVSAIHIHDCSEIWYALCGEAIHIVGEETFIQTAGTCVAVPAFVPHDIRVQKKEDTPIFVAINVSDAAMLKRGYDYFSYHNKRIHFEKKTLPIFTKLSPEKTIQANNIIHKLSAEFSALPDTSFDILLDLYADFLRILGGEESDFKLSKSLASRTDAILKATNYIFANRKEKITLKNLCEFTNMSRSRFCENFTKITGYSPMDYLFYIRMTQAKTQFLLRGKSLSEVAESVGASDKAHFCRLFKKRYGLTPSQYKKLYQKKELFGDLEARERRSNLNYLFEYFSKNTAQGK